MKEFVNSFTQQVCVCAAFTNLICTKSSAEMRKIMKRAGSVNKSGDHPIYCNSCGKSLKVENGILKEDAFEATKEWGYFSNRDMEVHRFNLCEECYEKLISEFKIPVDVRKKLEAL